MTQPPYPEYPQNSGNSQNPGGNNGSNGDGDTQPPAPDFSQQSYPSSSPSSPQPGYYQSGGQQQGGYPASGPSPAAPPRPNPVETKGFFGALFDFSFRSFVTIKFMSFIYVLSLLFLGVTWLFMLISSIYMMANDEALGGFALLIFGSIVAVFYLVMIRVGLEFMVAMVRTSQNTSATQAEIESLRWDLSQRS